jgi:hypothetical protein
MRSVRGGFIFRNRGPSLKVHHGQCLTSMTKHDSGGSPPGAACDSMKPPHDKTQGSTCSVFTRPTRPPVNRCEHLVVVLRPCVVRHMEWSCLDIDVGFYAFYAFYAGWQLLLDAFSCLGSLVGFRYVSSHNESQQFVPHIFVPHLETLSFLFFSC